MKVRTFLIRSITVVFALIVLLFMGGFIHDYLTQRDATSAVRVALDAHLAGRERANLSFLDEDLGESGTFDFAQFSIDIETGYELTPGERWMNTYDVDIVTGNGKTYVASPIGNTTRWPDGEEEFSWSIICCEPRN
jgi:hypothetical protein